MMFDWTQIIILLIGIVFSVLGTLVAKQLIPWLKDKKLYDAAVVAVDAAEALYGRYHGEEKLKTALDSLAAKGYKIDSKAVIEALNAAWKNLDSAMFFSGEKELLGING